MARRRSRRLAASSAAPGRPKPPGSRVVPPRARCLLPGGRASGLVGMLAQRYNSQIRQNRHGPPNLAGPLLMSDPAIPDQPLSPRRPEHVPPPPEPAATSPRKALLIVFLVVVIDLLGFGIVLPLLPRYAKDYVAPLLGAT